jgi:hypothetical protein
MKRLLKVAAAKLLSMFCPAIPERAQNRYAAPGDYELSETEYKDISFLAEKYKVIHSHTQVAGGRYPIFQEKLKELTRCF